MAHVKVGNPRRVWVRLPTSLEDTVPEDYQATVDTQTTQDRSTLLKWFPAQVKEEISDSKVVVSVEPFEDCLDDDEEEEMNAYHHYRDDENSLVNQELTVLTSDVVSRNIWEYPPDDLVQLVHLHEPAIVQALLERYKCENPYDHVQSIYTWCGPILLAVNPFQHMPHLYSEKITNTYIEQVRHQQQVAQGESATTKPHAFAVAASAYAQLTDALSVKATSVARRSQSILVSGESGAGKTETTKIVMRFLATVARPKSESSADNVASIEQRVLQSNPILEAFGNARTVRNDNSSRFGKFIRMRFKQQEDHMVMVGASIQTYLLEKVRLVQQGQGERCYHIFYQLLFGGTGTQLADCLLLNPQNEPLHPAEFRLLDQSDCFDRRDGVLDSDEFQRTVEAMSVMGFDREETQAVLRVVAAVLYLGNIEIQPTDSGSGKEETGSSMVAETVALDKFCKLLQLEPKDVNAALCTRRVHIGGAKQGPRGTPVRIARNAKPANDEEVFTKPLDVSHAEDTRDALTKSLYSKTFDWLVSRINQNISSQEQGYASRGAEEAKNMTPLRPNTRAVGNKSNPFVAVLDIFGFEIFEHNSFEQLCINYANERLQQQFNDYIFKHEQAMYNREQIKWSFIDFPSNTDTVQLIEGSSVGGQAALTSTPDKKGVGKTMGILAILDDECRMPQGDDTGFARKLYTTCEGMPNFQVTKTQRVNLEFTVHHYAGSVVYDAHGFCDKNRDQLRQEALDLLERSEMPLMAKILVATAQGSLETKASGTTPRRGEATPGSASRTRNRSGRISALSLRSLGGDFRTQLNSLVETISVTQPHYIRCLKPNDQAHAGSFNRARVVSQLRCGGVLEAVRVARAGFPIRMAHLSFLNRYRILLHAIGLRAVSSHLVKGTSSPGLGEDQLEGCVKFRKELYRKCFSGSNTKVPKDVKAKVATGFLKWLSELDEVRLQSKPASPANGSKGRFKLAESCQLGISKVFLRKRAHDLLESWLSIATHASVARIGAAVRGALSRNQYPFSFRHFRTSAVVVQCAVRSFFARERLTFLHKTKTAVQVQSLYRGLKNRARYRSMRQVAQWLQPQWRGRKGRQIYFEIQKDRAALRIQSWYRGVPWLQLFWRTRHAVVSLQCKARVVQARLAMKKVKAASRDLGNVRLENSKLKEKVSSLKRRVAELEAENRALREGSTESASLRTSSVDLASDDFSQWYNSEFQEDIAKVAQESESETIGELQEDIAKVAQESESETIGELQEVIAKVAQESESETIGELQEVIAKAPLKSESETIGKAQDSATFAKTEPHANDDTPIANELDGALKRLDDVWADTPNGELFTEMKAVCKQFELRREIKEMERAHKALVQAKAKEAGMQVKSESDSITDVEAVLKIQSKLAEATATADERQQRVRYLESELSQTIAAEQSLRNETKKEADEMLEQLECLAREKDETVQHYESAMEMMEKEKEKLLDAAEDAKEQAVDDAVEAATMKYQNMMNDLSEEHEREVDTLKAAYDEEIEGLKFEISKLEEQVSEGVERSDQLQQKELESLQEEILESRSELTHLRQQRALQTTALEAFKSNFATKVEMLEDTVKAQSNDLEAANLARANERMVSISKLIVDRRSRRLGAKVLRAWWLVARESKNLKQRGEHIATILKNSSLRRILQQWKDVCTEAKVHERLIERFQIAAEHRVLRSVIRSWRQLTQKRFRQDWLLGYHTEVFRGRRLQQKLFSRWAMYVQRKTHDALLFDHLRYLFDRSKEQRDQTKLRRLFDTWKAECHTSRHLTHLSHFWKASRDQKLVRRCFSAWKWAAKVVIENLPRRFNSGISSLSHDRRSARSFRSEEASAVDTGHSAIESAVESAEVSILSEVLKKFEVQQKKLDKLEGECEELKHQRMEFLTKGVMVPNQLRSVQSRKESQEQLMESIVSHKFESPRGDSKATWSEHHTFGQTPSNSGRHVQDSHDDDGSDFYTVRDRFPSMDPSPQRQRLTASSGKSSNLHEMQSVEEEDFASNISELDDDVETTHDVMLDNRSGDFDAPVPGGESPAVPPLPPPEALSSVPDLELPDVPEIAEPAPVHAGSVPDSIRREAHAAGVPLLMQAVKRGHVGSVKALLSPQGRHSVATSSGGPSLPAVDVNHVVRESGKTALHEAANLQWGAGAAAVEIGNALLEAGADPNVKDAEGCTPLFLAAKKGDEALPVSRALVTHGAALSGKAARGPRGRLPLHAAASASAHQTMHFLLSRGADFNGSDEAGLTALHIVAQNCDLKGIKQLVSVEKLAQSQAYKLGAESPPAKGRTEGGQSWSSVLAHLSPKPAREAPLEEAALGGLRRPDINLQDNLGNNALHMAVSHSAPEAAAIRLLISSGVRVDAQNDAGQTPLHILLHNPSTSRATVSSYIDAVLSNRHMYDAAVVEWCKETKVKADLEPESPHHPHLLLLYLLNIPDRNNNTPLHYACYQLDITCALEIVAYGAALYVPDNDRGTVLDLKGKDAAVGRALLHAIKTRPNLDHCRYIREKWKINNCQICFATFEVSTFGFSKNQVDCGHCGRAICAKCAPSPIAIPKLGIPESSRVVVCKHCFGLLEGIDGQSV